MTSRRNDITLAVLGMLAACGDRYRTPDDTLVLVIESDMTSGDPRYGVSGYNGKLDKLVCAGLTSVDSATLVPELALASEIKPVDKLTWDVTIRPDALFSDGTPVTAADVAATFNDVISPTSDSSSHKQLSDRFKSVEATGERSARFHLKNPLATFKSDLEFGILSFHNGRPENGEAICAGSYSINEITSEHVLLDANPNYFGPKPKMPHIEIKFVHDGSARLLMLVGGSADLVQNAVRLDLVDEVSARPGVKLASGPSVFLTFLLLNNTDPILQHKQVRQAIAMALDRPAIIAAKFGSRAQLASGLLPSSHWAYSKAMKQWNHDVAAAKRLLDEAGYKDPDGDGPRPRFTMSYKTSSDAFRVAVARVIAAQLAEVGIDVEVRSFEFGTFFADVKKGRYQLASMQTSDITEPDYYFTYFNSSWIPNDENPDGYNRWHYINPDVDRLTTEGRRELDLEKRKVIYAEVQRIVADDVPVVPLWHEDNIVLSNVDVNGYTITPNARFVGLRDVWKQRSPVPTP
jgi:peptide/nickel transport system substrate-binding protein